MTTNGGAHKFNKNENNWLHKHFEPQQIDVVVSSLLILALASLSAFARTHPLRGCCWGCLTQDTYLLGLIR